MKIVAEIAQYHDGSIGRIHAMIDALAKTGVNTIKFQTHIAEFESSIYEPWRIKFSYQDKTRFDYWKRMEFTKSEWKEIKSHVEENGMSFISSPFSVESAELLEEIGVKEWKIASGEIGNSLLVDYIFSTQKPVICSTGMSSWDEIDRFVSKAKKHNIDLTMLQCTSKYPTKPSDVGLNLINELRDRYDVKVGLSDHTGTIFPLLAACMLNVSCLEFHSCFSKLDFGPDVVASLTMEQISELCEGIHMLEEVLAKPVDKNTMALELEPMREIFTKSLHASKNIPKNTIISREDLIALKPMRGIPISDLENILGKKTANDLEKYQVIKMDDVYDEKDSSSN